METIRKRICLDDFLSHRPGIVPFVKKDSDDCSINYVDTVTSESNYGSFPCDFVLVSSQLYQDSVTQLSYRKNKELNRLRYLDIIRMYNEYSNAIKKSTVLRRISYTEEIETYRDCTTSPDETIQYETVTDIMWTTKNTDDVSIFECKAVDSSFFETVGIKIYKNKSKEEQRNDLLFKGESGEELTEEEQASLEYLNSYLDSSTGILYTEEFIVSIPDIDNLQKYEKFWSTWWEDNFALTSYCDAYNRWENLIFDSNYTEPKCLKFYYDVDKYILGRIVVPERIGESVIDGSKAPNVIYNLNYTEYKDWFEENSSSIEYNEELKKIWDNLGGDGFYNYLKSINPNFLNHLELNSTVSITAFTFAPPQMNIDLSFIEEYKPEDIFKPYDLSIDINNNVVDGTFTYSAKSGSIGSALTPVFKTFDDIEIYSESKLSYLASNKTYYVNEKIYGVFDEFDNEGKMFDCTYHTGDTSSHPSIDRCYDVILNEYIVRYINGEAHPIKVKEVRLYEQFESTVSVEELPKAGETTYQIVGIKLIDSAVTRENEQQEDKYEMIEGTRVLTSAYTYYDNKTINTYSWWSCKESPANNDYKCGDGENIDFSNSDKYRNLMLLSCVPNACETETGTYHYLVRYDNGYTNVTPGMYIGEGSGTKKLHLPYDLHKRTNITSLDGEFSGTIIYDELLEKNVIDLEDGQKALQLRYVIGATSGEDVNTTGIHYIEEFNYTGASLIHTVIDGMYDGEILYEIAEKPEVNYAYSEDYNLTREVSLARVTGMEIGTQWTSASCVNAYLFTEESSENLLEYPNVSVDISFNRGNASTWEKRFKLSECNTLEDLENYGNNYFNI